MKKKLLSILAVALLLVIPARAVFNESDFAKTLSILRSELHVEYERMVQMHAHLNQDSETQHRQLVEMTRRCNELALILYSQNQDYTFDMTYALEEVTRQYNDYNKQLINFARYCERVNYSRPLSRY